MGGQSQFGRGRAAGEPGVLLRLLRTAWLDAHVHDEELRLKVKRIVYDAKPIVNPLHFFID